MIARNKKHDIFAALSALLALAATPFVVAGSYSYDFAWREPWIQVFMDVPPALRIGQVKFLISCAVVSAIVFGFRIPIRPVSHRLFNGFAGSFWVAAGLTAFIVAMVASRGIPPQLRLLVAMSLFCGELWLGLALLARMLRPLAGGIDAWSKVLKLVLLPAWILEFLRIGLRRALSSYHHLTIEASASVMDWLRPGAAQVDLKRLMITFSGHPVRVLPACSGLESAILGAVVLSFVLFLLRRSLRWPRSLLVLPVGIALLWLANILRIVALFFYGDLVGWGPATQAFHSNAGWVLFNSVLLMFVGLTMRSRIFLAADRAEDARESLLSSPAALFLLPLVVMTFVGLITGSFRPGTLDPSYGIKILVVMLWMLASAKIGPATWKSWLSGSRPLYSIASGAALFVPWVVLELIRVRLFPVAAIDPVPFSRLGAWSWVLGSSLVVPIVEELAFRGYLLRRLDGNRAFERASFTAVGWRGTVLSSLIFAALHTQFLGAFLAGVVFARVVKKTNRLASAVMAHMTTNALWATYVAITDGWGRY